MSRSPLSESLKPFNGLTGISCIKKYLQGRPFQGALRKGPCSRFILSLDQPQVSTAGVLPVPKPFPFQEQRRSHFPRDKGLSLPLHCPGQHSALGGKSLQSHGLYRGPSSHNLLGLRATHTGGINPWGTQYLLRATWKVHLFFPSVKESPLYITKQPRTAQCRHRCSFHIFLCCMQLGSNTK